LAHNTIVNQWFYHQKPFVCRETRLEKTYQNECFSIESYASVVWTAAQKSQANSPEPVANVMFPA
jgi:hypothetical protein